MKILFTLFFIAISAYLTSARAQNDSKSAAPAQHAASPCPSAVEMDQQHLQGVWRAELAGHAVLLRLGQHPELGGSVRGTVQRGAATGLITGDVHEGELTLEESTDGKRISATWIGEVVDGRCGQEIRGNWHSVSPETSIPFVLRKQTPLPTLTHP